MRVLDPLKLCVVHLTSRIRNVLRYLGVRGALGYAGKEKCLGLLWKAIGRRCRRPVYRLYALDSRWPLYARAGSSDRDVFAEVFVRRQFAHLDYPGDPRLIVDCGANVGYVSRYFLTRFPNTHLLAIEPDHDSFEVLQQNVEPFRDRVTTLCAAVWSHGTRLSLSRGTYRDGREWATQVRECSGGEKANVAAVDIGSLLSERAFEHIDILKVDIEGAEKQLFAESCHTWIDKVSMIVIELHDEQCRKTFSEALGFSKFEFSVCGDLTVARRSEVPS
jgi:FkbM family methyltransferase